MHFCGGNNNSAEKYFKRIRNYKEKYCASGDFDRQLSECTPRKRFRCGYIDHLIAKFLKPPKDNKKRQKNVRFNEIGNRESQKESENGDDDNDQYIYAYMARMYGNDESSSRDFEDSLQ